jgi:AGCS family alanine or glycine:cation symporter
MALYYYAESNLELLMSKQNTQTRKIGLIALKVLFIVATFYFGITSNTMAWNVADIGVGVMAIINIIGILVIAKPAFISLKDFEAKEAAGKQDQHFMLSDVDDKDAFKGVEFWKDENIKRKYKI